VQTSQLVSLEDGVACIHLKGVSHPHLQDGVAQLGLATDLSGEVTQDSLLYLQIATGQVLRHSGEVRLKTASTTTLALAEGPKVFDMQADLNIDFDLVLTRLDGELVNPI
jgi:hypothetical protein